MAESKTCKHNTHLRSKWPCFEDLMDGDWKPQICHIIGKCRRLITWINSREIKMSSTCISLHKLLIVTHERPVLQIQTIISWLLLKVLEETPFCFSPRFWWLLTFFGIPCLAAATGQSLPFLLHGLIHDDPLSSHDLLMALGVEPPPVQYNLIWPDEICKEVSNKVTCTNSRQVNVTISFGGVQFNSRYLLIV